MKREDIDVSVAGDTLTTKGEEKTEAAVKEEDYYRSEPSYGSFFRSITLPSTVNSEKIEASYEDRVLEAIQLFVRKCPVECYFAPSRHLASSLE